MNFSRLMMLCLLSALFISCAPKIIPVERPPQAVWNEFRSGMALFSPEQSFLISASVSYITPNQRNRIQSTLWGYMGYPVRMDLSAGLGQTVAMWREDEQLWEAYFPGENMKYVHWDGSVGASILGYPTPLDLRQTINVLLGAFEGLVPESYCEVKSYNGMWKYHFREHEVESLVLAWDGSVSSITGRGWTVELSAGREEDTFHYYSRIDMQLSQDERALIRIRSIRLDDQKWDEEQLELNIPPDAGVVNLQDF